MLNLNDPTLLKQAALVGGDWVEASAETGIAVTNPATGDVIGYVPNLGAEETRQAIEAAEKARHGWAKRTAKERSQVLRRWFELMMENQDDLGAILTAEQGKPLAEAKGEIAYGASFVEWFAEEARRAYGDVTPGHAPDKRIITIKQPIGVVAAITPWNFPNAMITRKAGPAFAAGCSMVLKPASQTPYSAIALAVLAERAGLPSGLILSAYRFRQRHWRRDDLQQDRTKAYLYRLDRDWRSAIRTMRSHHQEAGAGIGRQCAVHCV